MQRETVVTRLCILISSEPRVLPSDSAEWSTCTQVTRTLVSAERLPNYRSTKGCFGRFSWLGFHAPFGVCHETKCWTEICYSSVFAARTYVLNVIFRGKTTWSARIPFVLLFVFSSHSSCLLTIWQHSLARVGVPAIETTNCTKFMRWRAMALQSFLSRRVLRIFNWRFPFVAWANFRWEVNSVKKRCICPLWWSFQAGKLLQGKLNSLLHCRNRKSLNMEAQTVHPDCPCTPQRSFLEGRRPPQTRAKLFLRVKHKRAGVEWDQLLSEWDVNTWILRNNSRWSHGAGQVPLRWLPKAGDGRRPEARCIRLVSGVAITKLTQRPEAVRELCGNDKADGSTRRRQTIAKAKPKSHRTRA